MRQADIGLPCQCGRCGKTYTYKQVKADRGWAPVRSGWRCGDCGRAHIKRVNDLADALLANHRRHDWAGTSEHTNYDECVFCDALTEATRRLLSAPEPPVKR
jgi:predicted DCC family thiol-disulfide oxidoreductase YuxK